MCSLIINTYYLLIIHILNIDLQSLTFYIEPMDSISDIRWSVSIYCVSIRMFKIEVQFQERQSIILIDMYIIYAYFML